MVYLGPEHHPWIKLTNQPSCEVGLESTGNPIQPHSGGKVPLGTFEADVKGAFATGV
jgi:hypothetical protein